MRRPRRPWTRLASAALAGHVGFELAAGVGLPLASVVGPAPAALLWAGATAGVQRAAGSPSAGAGLALVNATGLAAALAHLAGWPRRWTRVGLPWLLDCEGLGPELMRWYNPVVHLGGAASLVAALTEDRRRWPLLLVPALVPGLVRLQHAEHERLRARACRRPGWWNRRLRS
ncbi:hypothetical protein [Geodermatophilus sp. SYSU D00815]